MKFGTFLSEPTLPSTLFYTEACLLVWTTEASPLCQSGAVTLSLVHHCSFLRPLFINTDPCGSGTTLTDVDVLKQLSSYHNVSLKLTHIHTRTPFFQQLTHQPLGNLRPEISHLLTGAMMKGQSGFSLYLSVVIM
ncbi:hypothetical protein GOODEAATRI_022837 [Goodea atripinnis]|uniref:Uncharacterized protein n=1 Tax=Goodea atripinnis TaxID=208336 RepID=A0ABV0PR81_9TELE